MIYIVNNEEEYFDLIYDLNIYGDHYPNIYFDNDKNNLSVLSSFVKLDVDKIEEYFGISDFEIEIVKGVDENGDEYEEELFRLDYPLDRTKMQFVPELVQYLNQKPPTINDYPIIINWIFDESFDRIGRNDIFYFEWVSVKKSRSHFRGKSRVKRTRELWEKRYKKDYQDFVKYSKERYKD